jgi:hypothetical protein
MGKTLTKDKNCKKLVKLALFELLGEEREEKRMCRCMALTNFYFLLSPLSPARLPRCAKFERIRSTILQSLIYRLRFS